MNKCLHHVLGEAYFHKCLHACMHSNLSICQTTTQSILHHLLLSISLSSLSSLQPFSISLPPTQQRSPFLFLSMLLLLPLTLLVSLHHTPPKQQRTERREKKRSSVSATTTKPPPREFEAAAKRHCLRPPFHLLSLTQSDDFGEPPLTVSDNLSLSLSLSLFLSCTVSLPLP